MTLDAYAAWVASFMSEVGIEEPALVIGHSFGGGVAIKLTRNRPELVRYLVLLNAIGGLDSRYPWEWAIGFGLEFWPVTDAVALMRAIRVDLVPNLVRTLGLDPGRSPGSAGRPSSRTGRAQEVRCAGSGSDRRTGHAHPSLRLRGRVRHRRR